MNDSAVKKVLIISYVFPPMAAVGGFRIIKACKFLPEFNWQPVVLTVKDGFNYAYDHEGLKQLDPNLKIYRSKFVSPFLSRDQKPDNKSAELNTKSETKTATPPVKPSLFTRFKRYVRMMLSIPDSQNFWIPYAFMTGWKAIRDDQIDIILTTSPPASAHIIGYFLSLFTGVPLVVDFRDLWTQNEGYHLRKPPKLFITCDRFWEKRVLKKAKAVVAATDAFADTLSENNTYKPKNKFYGVTNGVDPDDFKNVTYPAEKNKKFSILHLGSLYGNRHPGFFFEILKVWSEKNPAVLIDVEVRFIGNTPGFEQSLIGTPLKNTVNFQKHVPQKEILPKLWEADLLLLILGFEQKASGVMPAKLFEYISTKRPILALIPEGVAADAIRKYDRGIAVTKPDVTEAVEFLESALQDWRNREGPPASEFALPDEYDRRAQNKKLAEILTSSIS